MNQRQTVRWSLIAVLAVALAVVVVNIDGGSTPTDA